MHISPYLQTGLYDHLGLVGGYQKFAEDVRAYFHLIFPEYPDGPVNAAAEKCLQVFFEMSHECFNVIVSSLSLLILDPIRLKSKNVAATKSRACSPRPYCAESVTTSVSATAR